MVWEANLIYAIQFGAMLFPINYVESFVACSIVIYEHGDDIPHASRGMFLCLQYMNSLESMSIDWNHGMILTGPSRTTLSNLDCIC